MRAANTNHFWSKDISTLQVTIVPPWYNTWLFYLISSAALVSLLVKLFKQRIKTIQEKTALSQRIFETEMAALKVQMSPHFMFNCINSIDAFIHNNDKYNATLYLNKFAKLLRNILDSSKQNTVLLSKDVDTL